LGGTSFTTSSREAGEKQYARRERNVRKLIERITLTLHTSQRVHTMALAFNSHLFASDFKKVKKDELIAVIMLAMAARHHSLPYTFKELAEACKKCSKKEICRGLKIYARDFMWDSNIQYCAQHMDYRRTLPRFSSWLGFDHTRERRATVKLSKLMKDPTHSATNPMTLVAVAMADASPAAIDDISFICGVSKHTIHKRTTK
jgi:transcription initiation factor TFIIIB Brf1 subunit/transcription initiation factor TFIIB